MAADTNVGNIIARVGADASPLSEELKKAQNTILTFKDESLAALKSFGLPHISSTNLVEAIESGQRVIVNFTQESGESLAQFQARVRATFAEAGIDISEYEKVLADANQIHAEFARGAVKNFQAVSAAAEEVNNKAEELRSSLGQSFNGITANFGAFKDSVGNAFKTLTDDSAGFGDKFGAVSQAVVDGFGLMTGAVEVFLAIEVVKKVGEWIDELKDLAAETQDVEQRFAASFGSVSGEADEFVEKLSKDNGLLDTTVKDQMSKEYLNSRMFGFDPEQSLKMSESITQLSYDLGKLRGEDPSQVFDAIQRGMEGETRGLKDIGIAVTATDLKNRALSEGIIKQGQTLTSQQTAMMAYQVIMEKTQGVMGYYKTTADDLSTQQTKLSAGWQQMKETLATDLTPAFSGLMQVLNFVATGLEEIVVIVGIAIQSISLFVEDAYSAIKDVLGMNFGQINQDWANNYNSIYNSTAAAEKYGEALDKAITAGNDNQAALDAQNQAQKNLNKSVNANTMSFDELHNITNSGTAGALAQADAVNNLADALTNLNAKNGGATGDGGGSPFTMPALPPLPPGKPPITFTAIDKVSPVVTDIMLALALIPKLKSISLWAFDGVKAIIARVLPELATLPKAEVIPIEAVPEVMPGIETAEAELLALRPDPEIVPIIAAPEVLPGIENAEEELLALKPNPVIVPILATNLVMMVIPAVLTELASIPKLINTKITATDGISTVIDTIKGKFDGLKTTIAGVGTVLAGIGTGLSGLGSSISQGIQSIGPNLSGIGSFLESVGGVAGAAALALAPIGLATGGVVTGPTLAMVGEGGGPEAVIPLDRLGSVLDQAGAGSTKKESPGQPIQVNIDLDGRTLARTLYSYNVNENDRIGKMIGYNSSYNLPK